MKKYAVYRDGAAGLYRIVEYWTDDLWPRGQRTWQNLAPGSHFTKVRTYEDHEEAIDYIEQRRAASKVFAVFFDRASCHGFVSEEDTASGNWKGSKHTPYSYMASFSSKAEARAHLSKLLRR